MPVKIKPLFDSKGDQLTCASSFSGEYLNVSTTAGDFCEKNTEEVGTRGCEKNQSPDFPYII